MIAQRCVEHRFNLARLGSSGTATTETRLRPIWSVEDLSRLTELNQSNYMSAL
jgi:hypothetical protein